MDTDDQETDEIQFKVKAIVKKKLLFKIRPKPIIANVPKKIWTCGIIIWTAYYQVLNWSV